MRQLREQKLSTVVVYLLPSGNSGLILGLIFGTSAGETSFEPLALMLPRFLFPLPFLLRIAEGVLAVIGEPMAGDCTADGGLADDGVLSGPSFGVLRADRRGVFSSPSGSDI